MRVVYHSRDLSITQFRHWGRVTHVCVSELTIIGSDNGFSPGRRQAIIWNNAGLLLIEPLGTNFSEISIGIQTFSFKKIHLNMSSAKWRPLCLGLNVLICRLLWDLYTELIVRCTVYTETRQVPIYWTRIWCLQMSCSTGTVPSFRQTLWIRNKIFFFHAMIWYKFKLNNTFSHPVIKIELNRT